MAVIDESSVAITVPADYLEDLCSAIVAEIHEDSKRLRANQADVGPGEYRELRQEDRDDAVRELHRDMRVLDQLLLGATEAVQVAAERQSLFFALEAMVKLLSDRLAHECKVTPLNTGAVLDLVGRLQWAAEQAQPLAR